MGASGATQKQKDESVEQKKRKATGRNLNRVVHPYFPSRENGERGSG
jgi:hypothetical protein